MPAPLRASPLLVGLAISLALSCALALAYVAGVLPKLVPARPSAAAFEPGTLPPVPDALKTGAVPCAACGTVVMIRTYELRGDVSPFGAVGAVAPGAVTLGQAAARTTDVQAPNAADAVKRRFVYRVTVRMDDGSYRTLSQGAEPTFRPGDKVRLQQGALVGGA
jgi:hypothetical protein